MLKKLFLLALLAHGHTSVLAITRLLDFAANCAAAYAVGQMAKKEYEIELAKNQTTSKEFVNEMGRKTIIEMRFTPNNSNKSSLAHISQETLQFCKAVKSSPKLLFWSTVAAYRVIRTIQSSFSQSKAPKMPGIGDFRGK